MIDHSSEAITFPQGTSVMHRIRTEKSTTPIFLLHGYFEDSKIFYSKSMKGLAPFLAENGFDVFVCDLPGKGKSLPQVGKGFEHSQYDIIVHDIPKYLEYIRKVTGKQDLHIGAHSWGGVDVLAYMARFEDKHVKSIFTFGSKRRINVKGWHKLVAINFGWNFIGRLSLVSKGYVSAKMLGLGGVNEPKAYYEQTDKWVKEKDWIDPVDHFDYHKAFEKVHLPPTLYITGEDDKILGNPVDVKALMDETGPNQPTVYKVIGKSSGYQNNYDHINLLTHPDAREEHFKLVLEFLMEHE